jgi:hypothetical protein
LNHITARHQGEVARDNERTLVCNSNPVGERPVLSGEASGFSNDAPLSFRSRSPRPGGAPDSSPAFQRRVADRIDFRPVGTAEMVSAAIRVVSGVPTVRVSLRAGYPPVNWRATIRGPSWTFWSIFQSPCTRCPAHSRHRDFRSPPMDNYEVP